MPDELPWPTLRFEHYLLQPMDGPFAAQNTIAAVAYCQANPNGTFTADTRVLGNPLAPFRIDYAIDPHSEIDALEPWQLLVR